MSTIERDILVVCVSFYLLKIERSIELVLYVNVVQMSCLTICEFSWAASGEGCGIIKKCCNVVVDLEWRSKGTIA